MSLESDVIVTKNRMTATFVNLYDGRPVQIEVSGKFTARDATIKLSTGRLLGRIRRSGPDEYALEVCLADWLQRDDESEDLIFTSSPLQIYPGVDVVLLVVIAVAFSERGQENNRSAWTT